jgi:hypothetical protein
MRWFLFWQRWLLIASLLVAAFGLALALAGRTPLFALFNSRIDPLFWGPGPLPPGSERFVRWVYGAWGATVAGWGLLLAYVAQHAFKQRQPWAWNALALGLAVWYALDTYFSLQQGVAINALLNTVLLAVLGLPLALTRRSF